MKTQQTLELKHLAPYLPYNLNTNYGNIIGIRNWVCWCGTFKAEFGENNIPLSVIKPILRPLLDLKNEISISGKEFVPIDELLLNRDVDAEYDFIEALEDDWHSASDKMQYVPYSLIQRMLEWHFDVFGLIEKGLAIDINSLNK